MSKSETTIPLKTAVGPRRNGPMKREKVKDTKGTILRIWRYLSVDKSKIVIAFCCVMVSTIFTLLASYMIRPIINGILTNQGTGHFIQHLIFMFLVYLIALLANYLQSYIMLKISQNSLEAMRNDLFEKMQKLPLRYYDTNHNGQLMSRFTNDVDAISQMLSNTFVQLVSGIITLVGTTCLMLYTNWILTIVTVLMVPVFSFVGKFISKRSRKYYKEQQRTIGELNGYIEEMVSGQKVIKVFNYEAKNIEDFKKLNQAYRDKVFFAQFIGGIMGPIMGTLSQLNYILTAVVGGFLCVLNGFDIGGYTIFVNYSRSFSRPINDITMQVNVIFSALAGAERVFNMMDETPENEVKNPTVLDEIKGNVELLNVDFSYQAGKKILKDISLYAKPSQKIAFVGSTGAGKTTITNLLNRFYEIESGTITIDGIDIKKLDKAFLRQNIAMVLQDTHLFTGTIKDNIRYGRLDATDEEVIEAAKAANAHLFIKRLKHGYDTMLEGDGANLSQGQRQLLNIARAAISKAPILVLDEATSSVDTRTEKHIEQALDRLMASRTTFVIAHRLSTVRNATAIMVLEKGEIIERGSHEELIEKQGRYYQLYNGLSKLD